MAAKSRESAALQPVSKSGTGKASKRNITYINVLQVLTVAALLGYMEYAVTSGKINRIFMASPSSIVEEAFHIAADGTLWPHLILTLQEVLVGYALAAGVGIIVGLIWTMFPKTEAYGNVFCSAIMAIPKTAILPLLILWFGIGFQSKVVLIFLFSVFQILYSTVTGAKQCKIEYLKVARVFNATKMQTVFKVMIPAALPSMFNGLRLAAATALTGVVFSEMQSAKAGLGYLLSESQNLLNTPRMFFIIILVTLISVCFVKLIAAIEYLLCHRWSRV
jgi:ABC-type nitrate/sulfonate/bicarbonate transport system permease component